MSCRTLRNEAQEPLFCGATPPPSSFDEDMSESGSNGLGAGVVGVVGVSYGQSRRSEGCRLMALLYRSDRTWGVTLGTLARRLFAPAITLLPRLCPIPSLPLLRHGAAPFVQASKQAIGAEHHYYIDN